MLLALILLAVVWGFFGRFVPLRKIYIEILLKIFEFGSSVVHEKNKKDAKHNHLNHDDTTISECDNDSTTVEGQNGTISTGTGSTNKLQHKSSNSLISREFILTAPGVEQAPLERKKSADDVKPNESTGFDFQLESSFDYIRTGVEAIIEDEVTSRFEAEELKNWNLLTRTNRFYEFINWKLSTMWVVGFLVRYSILLPLRVTICFVGVWYLIAWTAIIGLALPSGEFKRRTIKRVLIHCFEFLSSALSTVITYHNLENRPVNGICVANHTSPIDVLMLMCDNCYSLIGQSHGGFLGLLQRALARASPHIWFERAEAKDRLAVAKRLRAHVSDTTNPPILIFPGELMDKSPHCYRLLFTQLCVFVLF